MSVQTKWGYTLPDLDSLPDMLSDEEFDEFTANRYAGDVRIAPNIKSACAAVRNYCGWHIFPSASCEMSVLMNDKRVTRIGNDLLIQLPAAFVTEVESVTIDGETYMATCETNGILRVYDVEFSTLKRYSPIEVTYKAGVDEDTIDELKELIASRVTHATASSNGITSEAAGGVSVTYNASWVNSASATTLPDSTREVLAPYRVRGVF
jgi:hypothetical protein